MPVGDDGAQSDFDRKRMDHNSTARGDKPLDRGPHVLDEQIDSSRPAARSAARAQRRCRADAAPPDSDAAQMTSCPNARKHNPGLEIADGKLQAIELAYERRMRRSTHEGESRVATGLSAGPRASAIAPRHARRRAARATASRQSSTPSAPLRSDRRSSAASVSPMVRDTLACTP